jgi:hypothetical protein
MSCKILVFLGNILDNVGSRDVELLELLVGVFCALGVEFSPANLTGVVYVAICVTFLGVKVVVH